MYSNLLYVIINVLNWITTMIEFKNLLTSQKIMLAFVAALILTFSGVLVYNTSNVKVEDIRQSNTL